MAMPWRPIVHGFYGSRPAEASAGGSDSFFINFSYRFSFKQNVSHPKKIPPMGNKIAVSKMNVRNGSFFRARQENSTIIKSAQVEPQPMTPHIRMNRLRPMHLCLDQAAMNLLSFVIVRLRYGFSPAPRP